MLETYDSKPPTTNCFKIWCESSGLEDINNNNNNSKCDVHASFVMDYQWILVFVVLYTGFILMTKMLGKTIFGVWYLYEPYII